VVREVEKSVFMSTRERKAKVLKIKDLVIRKVRVIMKDQVREMGKE
jgi:hypothetical protein